MCHEIVSQICDSTGVLDIVLNFAQQSESFNGVVLEYFVGENRCIFETQPIVECNLEVSGCSNGFHGLKMVKKVKMVKMVKNSAWKWMKMS
ncbi:hypothetical protein ECANGB1_303 [Enterospora canceri]|uniref:Uncharacterized protein n=1 Tax=Enterospora canceri TaxID=1081671 RepID=A0A1Y1S8X2_9MICR|nr:hypothetical protein ECANGB1_303 [Enterospora canceri]